MNAGHMPRKRRKRVCFVVEVKKRFVDTEIFSCEQRNEETCELVLAHIEQTRISCERGGEFGEQPLKDLCGWKLHPVRDACCRLPIQKRAREVSVRNDDLRSMVPGLRPHDLTAGLAATCVGSAGTARTEERRRVRVLYA